MRGAPSSGARVCSARQWRLALVTSSAVAGLVALAMPLGAEALAPADAAQREEAGLSDNERVMLRAVKLERGVEVMRRVEAQIGRSFDPAWLRVVASRLAEHFAKDELEAAAASADPRSWLEKVGDKAAVTGRLTYTPVTPCHVFDTSISSGPLVPGTAKALRVAGTGFAFQGGPAEGCGVPFGPATAVMLNFTAKNPVGKGNVRAYAWDNPAPMPPNASIINDNQITATNGLGMNIANGVVVPLCATDSCSFDLFALAEFAGTDLIGDVLGYFSYYMTAPVQVRDLSFVAIGETCANVYAVTITTPVAGNVLARATALVAIGHTSGTTRLQGILSLDQSELLSGSRLGRTGVGRRHDGDEFGLPNRRWREDLQHPGWVQHLRFERGRLSRTRYRVPPQPDSGLPAVTNPAEPPWQRPLPIALASRAAG